MLTQINHVSTCKYTGILRMLAFTTLGLLIISCGGGDEGGGSTRNEGWVQVTASTEFCPRDSSPNGVLYYKDTFWILEGYRRYGDIFYSTSDVWSSENGRNWTLVNDNPPYQPYSAFVVFDDYMWAFGSMSSYRSSDGRNWEQVELPPFIPRAATIFQNKIWMLDYNHSVWSSENGLAWTLIADKTPWLARTWPAWVSLKGRLWLFGGGGYSDGQYFYRNDVWSSEDGKNWSLISSAAPWQGRFWHGSAAYDGKLWILGGYRQDNSIGRGDFNDVWFSEDGLSWKQQDRVEWTPRHAMFVWVARGSLWISSGFGDSSDPYNDVWQYTSAY